MVSQPRRLDGARGVVVQMVAALGVLVATIAGVELTCRLLLGPPAERSPDAVDAVLRVPKSNPVPLIADPALLWRNQPSATRTQPINPKAHGREASWGIAIDSKGYRGPEPESATEGVYRILCVGDSITFGFNVDQGEEFARRLEAILQSRHPGHRIEVINAAVVGWSWEQGLRFLELEGMALRPSLVLMSHGTNDQFWAASTTDRERLLPSRSRSAIQFLVSLLGRTSTYRAARRLARTPEIESGASPACAAQRLASGVCRRVSLPEIGEAVHEVHRLTSAAGANLLLLNLDFIRTNAVQASRATAKQERIAFLDFVARFDELRRSDETSRAERLRLAPAGPLPPDRRGERRAGGPGHRTVLFRVEATAGKPTAVVSHFGDEFRFEASMYDDGTHGDETAGDGVFSALVDVPARAAKLDYLYTQDGTKEFVPLPPVPSKGGYRLIRLEGDTIAPIDTFGDLFLMAEQTHPDARGHAVIAAEIARQIEESESFRTFLAKAPPHT